MSQQRYRLFDADVDRADTPGVQHETIHIEVGGQVAAYEDIEAHEIQVWRNSPPAA